MSRGGSAAQARLDLLHIMDPRDGHALGPHAAWPQRLSALVHSDELERSATFAHHSGPKQFSPPEFAWLDRRLPLLLSAGGKSRQRPHHRDQHRCVVRVRTPTILTPSAAPETPRRAPTRRHTRTERACCRTSLSFHGACASSCALPHPGPPAPANHVTRTEHYHALGSRI